MFTPFNSLLVILTIFFIADDIVNLNITTNVYKMYFIFIFI